MCTLIIARNLFRFYPLVAAANRDERRGRPSSAPTVLEGPQRILAPTDDVFGGTWIGANAAGVIVAITNRENVPHAGDRVSRGMLVRVALECGSATEALSRVIDLGGGTFNGFHLAIVDRMDGYLALGDGEEIRAEPMNDGLTVVTEEGWERDHSPRETRIRSVFLRQVVDHPPRPSTFAPLLNLHDYSHADAGETGSCLHGAPDDEWVTKSSALIRPQSRMRSDGFQRAYWEYFHRERMGGRPNCESPWSIHELDLIRTDLR